MSCHDTDRHDKPQQRMNVKLGEELRPFTQM